MDLIEQLEQKLAETERIALEAERKGRWEDPNDPADVWVAAPVQPPAEVPLVDVRVFGNGDGTIAGDVSAAHGVHIAHNNPKRILDKVAADREILDLHTGSHECTSAADNCVWISGEPGDECETVRLLAKGYQIEDLEKEADEG